MSAHTTASSAGSLIFSRTWHRLAGSGRWARRLRRLLRSAWRALTAGLARHRAQALAMQAHMACAEEGAGLEFGTVELDGRRWGALYRRGELVCLLESVERL